MFKACAKTEDGRTVWLGRVGNACICVEDEAEAHAFETADEIEARWGSWSGRPAGAVLVPGSLEIIRVEAAPDTPVEPQEAHAEALGEGG